MVGLVPLLLKSNSANLLIEDYAACLELRSEGCQIIENSCDDPGVLIMQVSVFTYALFFPDDLEFQIIFFMFVLFHIAASH